MDRTAAQKREREKVEKRLAAVMHHDRRAILQHLMEHGVKSPKQVADELGKDVKALAYHFRVLLKHECIEEVDRRPVRGATEHFYRHKEWSLIDTSEWESVPPALRIAAIADFVQPHVDDVTRAVHADTLGNDSNWVLTRTPLLALDQQGYAELQDLHETLVQATFRIKEESAERLASSDETPLKASSIQGFFRLPNF